MSLLGRLVEDRAWAIMTIWQEASGEPYEGRLAVARVIRNRMSRHYMSDGTLIGTVLYPYQFSGWNTTSANRRQSALLDVDSPVVVSCAKAWDATEDPTVDGGVGTAVLYYNPAFVSPAPAWAQSDKQVAVVGQHHFFNA